MFLKRISARSFMGARHADIALGSKVTLLAGSNGAGKSSLIEGVKSALLGRLDRIKLKKDYAQAITEGERTGTVIVETDAGRCALTLPNGKHESEFAPHPALPLALDVHGFSSLDSSERRVLLMQVCAVTADPDAIAKRLVTEYDCDGTLTLDAMPYFVGGGFTGAEKHARDKTSEARGAWKATTGKPWGSQHSAVWEADPVAPVSEDEVKAAHAAMEATEKALAAALRAQGAIDQQARTYAKSFDEIARQKEIASKADRVRDKLLRDTAELTVWTEKLAALPPPAGTPVETLACPDCGSSLVMRSGKLAHYEAPPEDPHLEVKRKSQQDAVALYRSSVENGKRDLQAAEKASVKLTELLALEPVAEGALTAAREQVEACEADHVTALDASHDLAHRAKAHDAAILQTATARNLHHEVMQWLKLAEALSPQGLPARLMAEALDPINDACARFCDLAGWKTVTVDADMRILFGGRLHSLLSKGEQYRADVALTVALSGLAGIGLVLLDGADVLDSQGREDLLFALCEEPGIDQALVGMTLKARPAALPDGCACEWVDKGYVGKEVACA